MKDNLQKKFSLALKILVIILVIFIIVKSDDNVLEEGIFHTRRVDEEKEVLIGIDVSDTNNINIDGKIKAGVIPHHLLPGYMIADFFSLLKKQNPGTIILIGPNHNNIGDYDILTSDIPWDTKFGSVDVNTDIIDSLVQTDLVNIDNETVDSEHSVASIMPFVQYYLPKAKVVPLIIKPQTDINDIESVVKTIEDPKEDIVFVTAVDFSHYLTSAQAEKNDEATLALIKNSDYYGLQLLGDDHVDSPKSLIFLLNYVDNKKLSKPVVVHHTNSGIMAGDTAARTTSYFVIVYLAK